MENDTTKKTDRRATRDEVRWSKLDNAAHLFPAIAGAGMSNVYRIAVYLDDDIVPEKLQEALDLVLPQFPVFNVRLRQGMFWYYFEENGREAPRVAMEDTYPCRRIEANRNRNYLFRVTYYGRRVNLETFHVLTDGTGALYFLKELTYQYLRLTYPELRERYGDGLSSATSLSTEDSFVQNYKRTRVEKGYQSFRAFQLRGAQFPSGKMGIFHGHMPAEEVRRAAKGYDATVNEYLVAVLIWSVYHSCLRGAPSKTPISVAVPVNLRPYFDSVTAKNFFVMLTADFLPEEENRTFEDVIAAVKASLEGQRTKEHLESVLSYNVSGEQRAILRAIPLIFKNPGLRGIYNRHARANTTTLTNLGVVAVDPPYRPYICGFDAMLSRSKGQNLKVAVSTYEGTLTATIMSVLRDVTVQRVFFRFLVSQGIPVTIESNGVYYE